MPPIDHFLNNHAQYYSTYDFKRILEIAGFELQKLVLVKERVLLAEGINEVPVLKAAIVDTQLFRFCYPVIYPRYASKSIDNSILGECDNANIRFSVFFNKTGFFSPLWETIIKGNLEYKPEGYRVDWDVMQGFAPKMTRQQYYFLKDQSAKSTAIENHEVILRTLPIWLRSTSVLTEDTDPI